MISRMQARWLLAVCMHAGLLLSALMVLLPSAASAAKLGELCGARGGWSAKCDAPLKCDVRWAHGSGKIGVCTEPVRRCGGLQGASCAANEYCDFAPDALCGAADQTGTCRRRPTQCTFEYRPVCGCDGQTYPNACAARAAGVSVGPADACEECVDDEDCPNGFCDRGVTCQGTGCPPPPPNQCTTCGDGTELRCKRAELPCPEGQVREIVQGCYGECVDRHTCEPPDADTCRYGGKEYQVGDSFPADDGCNHCSCGEGGHVQCTLKLCSCDDGDPRRKWVSRDVNQCRLMLYVCADGLKPFTNACGCGCEPAPAPAGCHVGGCSGQLCLEPGDDRATTCEWRPEYACYRSATCERQPSGACGWTQTPELRACLGGSTL